MYPHLKRLVDVVLALLGLLVVAPLLAVIAVGVRLDSPGPVIFSQPRLGRGGREFFMHKFRKFPGDWGERGPAVTVAGDARMTRLGRLLERTKLDELPQLWNVLKGEMSFVGPRPLTLRSRRLFVGEFARVLDFVPGIFGPNQISLRNEARLYPPDQDPEVFFRTVLFPAKARADIAYFSRATLASDLWLMLRGLWCSLAGAVDWGLLRRRHGRTLLMDGLFIEFAWVSANLLRFEGLPPDRYWPAFGTGSWLMPVMVLAALWLGGNYRRLIRHFGAEDALRLSVSGFMGWMGAMFALQLLHRPAVSLGLLPLGFLLSLSLMLGWRLWTRRHAIPDRRRRGGDDHVKLAIYGAGHRGAALLALLEHGFDRARVAGFLDDDDAERRGRLVAGRPVLGSERDLDTVQALHRLTQIWMTFVPDPLKRQRLAAWCKAHRVDLVVLPELKAFAALTERRHGQVPEGIGDGEDWAEPGRVAVVGDCPVAAE